MESCTPNEIDDFLDTVDSGYCQNGKVSALAEFGEKKLTVLPEGVM